MTQRPFKFPLEEQKELFPDMKHDSTYMYDDDTLIAGTDNYWNKDSRLMTTEMIRHYEFVDLDGQRRVRKVQRKRHTLTLMNNDTILLVLHLSRFYDTCDTYPFYCTND